MKKNILLALFLGFPILIFSQDVSAPAEPAVSVSRVDIQGNAKVSTAKIITNIKSRAGQTYNENIINEDIKSLYATGFFETVDAETKKEPSGVTVIFKIKEKPVLKKLDINGTHFIRRNKVVEIVNIKEGSFVDEFVLKEAQNKIKDLYDKQGFADNQAEYALNINDKNEATVTFTITEKKILKIKSVIFKGNKAYKSQRLQKLIKTRRAWIFNKGIYQQNVSKDDSERIADFYRLQGYSDVQVTVDNKYLTNGIQAIFNITEGKCYFLGELKIIGCEKITLTDIQKTMQLKTNGIFSEQAVFDETSRIREIYMDRGYIFVQIEPATFYNTKTDRVDVDFKIVENNPAYIERIDIKGNVKTKDKIIRRELRIYPQDRFDGQKIKKSKQRLDDLGYFEEVRFGTEASAGNEPDKVNLITDVKETKTGTFSFGGGYSTVDRFLGFVEIRQRNFDYKNWKTFTGGGQDLALQFSLGGVSQNFQLSFTNPYIFDSPWTFGFDGYRKTHDKDSGVGYGYKESTTGGDLRFAREFTDQIKGSITYRLEQIDISDIDTDAAQDLKDQDGNNMLSSGEFGFSYDTRDSILNPTKGFFAGNTLQITGGPFLGDRDFYKENIKFSYDIPLKKKSVLDLQARAGFADAFGSTDRIPIYERYFAGGASTIRGYRERKIGPIDPNTNDPVGGESMFVGNIEYTYPFVDFIKAAVFFDTGNVWEKNTKIMTGGLKSGYGLGLRMKTPIGPVSIDYGIPMDKESGASSKKSGRFHFNISKGF